MKQLVTCLSIAISLLAISCMNDEAEKNKKATTSNSASADTNTHRLYYGGDILTMEGDQPVYAEALVTQNGKIAFVGSKTDAEKLFNRATKIDLQGKTLTPGFVDGHTHFLSLGSQAVGANLLAPPDGAVNTIDDLVEKLQEFSKNPDIKKTGWIFGIGYDDALLGRHPNRDDLDKVSTELPVMAVHISGHFSAVNSKALEIIGYTTDTKDPEGGIIQRRPGSKEPLGVNEELAHIVYVFKAIDPAKTEDKLYFTKKALDLAKSYGYTTINEGRAFAAQHKTMKEQSQSGLYDIDVISYIDYVDRKVLDEEKVSRTYNNHYRIGGMKITLDGSPQGRTAWTTIPYLIPPDGQQKGYKGYPALPDTKVVAGLFDEAYQKNWPTKVHANGDAAIDQMIKAIEPAHKKYGGADRRHVLIHGQFVRKDQLVKLKELSVIPSLFPMHTFYWGDWYDKIIGTERAAQISPMRTAIDMGMMPTSHTDAPVAMPNLMFVAYATTNRITRSGKIQGPKERITPFEAMKTITIWGARQHFEEGQKGSLKIGKLADMVILSANPCKGNPEAMKDIKVLETIKEGKTVYKRN